MGDGSCLCVCRLGGDVSASIAGYPGWVLFVEGSSRCADLCLREPVNEWPPHQTVVPYVEHAFYLDFDEERLWVSGFKELSWFHDFREGLFELVAGVWGAGWSFEHAPDVETVARHAELRWPSVAPPSLQLQSNRKRKRARTARAPGDVAPRLFEDGVDPRRAVAERWVVPYLACRVPGWIEGVSPEFQGHADQAVREVEDKVRLREAFAERWPDIQWIHGEPSD